MRCGINCTHSPTPRDYYALKACRNRRRKTCGRLRAAENPRLGPGVGVAGPRPVAMSRCARGLAGFFATWFAGGKWPARGPMRALASSRPPTPKEFFAETAPPTKVGSQLPACQDRKLTELLDSYPTSKPNQLWGLLSE